MGTHVSVLTKIQTLLDGRNARQQINYLERQEKFKAQFTHPSFGIPANYFTPSSKDRKCRDCDKILDGFVMTFTYDISREAYLREFSLKKWAKLPSSEKVQHTLSKCTRCFEKHQRHQLLFLLKPVYHPEPVITIDRDILHRQGTKVFTSNVVSELNRVLSDEVGSTFTEALLQNKSLRLERKKNSTEKRREKRQLHREVTHKISESFAENARPVRRGGFWGLWVTPL